MGKTETERNGKGAFQEGEVHLSLPPSPVTNRQRDEQLPPLSLSLTLHCFIDKKKSEQKLVRCDASAVFL